MSRINQETLPVVDTHTHVVAADRQAYPLYSEERTEATIWCLEHAVTTPELLTLAGEAGVSRTVLVQALSGHGYDNAYVSDSVRAFPRQTVGVGAVDPIAADPVGQLRRAVQEDGMRGIRIFDLDPPVLDLPAMRPIARAAGELDVPLVVMTSYPRLPLLHSLLDAAPGLRLVIDHCGLPDLGARKWWDETSELLRLAQRSRVFLKVTAFTLTRLPAGEAARFGTELAERVPSSRLMWGSDFPHTFDRPYAALVDEARLMASGMSGPDAAEFLAGTASVLWPGHMPDAEAGEECGK